MATEPNSSYDADADKKYAPGEHDNLGVSPDQAKQEVADLESMYGAESAPEPTYKSSGEEGGKEAPTAATDAGELNEAEQLGKGYTPDKKQETDKNGLFSKIKNSSKSKKTAALFGSAAGVGGLIAVVVLLLMLASALKIPDLAQNITNYEMARMSRQFADSVAETSDEALALQGTDDATYTGLRGIYQSTKGQVSDMWSKLDNYRPQKIINNLKSDSNGLGFNYSKPNAIGRQRLVSVSLNGEEFETADQGFSRFVPGLKQIVKFKNDVSFASDFAPALDQSLMDQDIGPIIRGLVANNLRKELGISLTAWALGAFKGKNTPAEAQVEETEQRVQDVDGQANEISSTASSSQLASAEQGAEQATEAAATSDTAVKAAIANNGILQSVQSVIASAFKVTGLGTVLKVADPALAIAQPVCIVYDGSLDKATSTIDKQTTQVQSAYFYVASAADQQKDGVQSNDPDAPEELASAVSGLNDTLGNTMTSNAYIRASGGTVSTSGTMSPEASAAGEFTLLNALIGSNSVASAINAIANVACPILTNTGLAAALAGLNVAAAVGTGGTSDGLEDAAADAATQATTTEAKGIFTNLITRYLGQSAGRGAELLYNTGKGTITSVITVAAMTIVAKLIVLEQSGQMFSGFSMGDDLANAADAGGNVQGNELERTQLFGRPLTETEVCQSDQQDVQYEYAQESKRSAYDRYLSPSYADSLLSRTAVMFGDDFNTSYGSGLLNTIGSTLLKPFTGIGWLSTLFMGKTFAAAATDCNDNATDYGNVQFGWSQDEENLLQSNVTYRPLENQQILDQSGEEAAIASKYAVCFGYKYNPDGDGSFDPTDPNGDMVLNDGPGDDGSIGTVLSQGMIIRDVNGNVIDAGDPTQGTGYGTCSPTNLGYKSGDPLSVDSDSASPQYRDMIFRFRLAMSYDTTIDQLTSYESVSND
jgi:hypothetical protein